MAWQSRPPSDMPPLLREAPSRPYGTFLRLSLTEACQKLQGFIPAECHYCSNVTTTGGCSGTEGATGDTEPTDFDDVGCFPASASTLVQVSGCSGTNTGFDGVPYQKVW